MPAWRRELRTPLGIPRPAFPTTRNLRVGLCDYKRGRAANAQIATHSRGVLTVSDVSPNSGVRIPMTPDHDRRRTIASGGGVDRSAVAEIHLIVAPVADGSCGRQASSRCTPSSGAAPDGRRKPFGRPASGRRPSGRDSQWPRTSPRPELPVVARQKDPLPGVLLSDPLGGAPNWEPLRPGSRKDADWHPLAHLRECARR